MSWKQTLVLSAALLLASGGVIWSNHTTHAQGSMMGIPVMPAGAMVIITSGSCTAPWKEISALNGVFPLGTVAANGDVGTTGGAATITPQGIVSQPIFTGTSQNFGTALNVSLLGLGTALTGPSTITPSGTVSQPTFTGTPFDNRPQFIKVIYCSL